MAVKDNIQKDYFERINKVLLYINNNLGETMSIEKLAGIANFSPFHFHRILTAYLHEPLIAYIIRIRLDNAARLLRYTAEPVNEIAYKVGYDSPSSLTKAFKKRFGVSPAEFRDQHKDLPAEGIFLKSDFSFIEIKPRIKVLESKKVVYVQTIGKYGDENIGKAWEKITTFVKKNRLFSWKFEGIGISYDDPRITEEEKCRYEACITVNREIKPEGETGFKIIEGGKYAIFRFKGPYNNFTKAYEYIYTAWLPQSGYELRNVPGFEIYLNNPECTKPENFKTDLYIPIK
jgi:AraC family transcriptional regulator